MCFLVFLTIACYSSYSQLAYRRLLAGSTTRGLHLSQARASLAEEAAVSADRMQRRYLKEQCILVDEEDRVVGSATKADCHFTQTG